MLLATSACNQYKLKLEKYHLVKFFCGFWLDKMLPDYEETLNKLCAGLSWESHQLFLKGNSGNYELQQIIVHYLNK